MSRIFLVQWKYVKKQISFCVHKIILKKGYLIMGRPYKPHTQMHMRFDSDIYNRLKEYINAVNKEEREKGKRLTTMTEIVETAVLRYLNEKEL